MRTFRYALGVETRVRWRYATLVDVESAQGPVRVDGLAPGAAYRIAVDAPGHGCCLVQAMEGRPAR